MNEALTLNDIYSEPQTTRPEDGVFHSSTLKATCPCNAVKLSEEVYAPTVNGSLNVNAQISKDAFLEKMLELIKYAKSIGFEVNNISINQW